MVVSCAEDYGNLGFRARVMENRKRYLEPLLAAWRKTGVSHVIHAHNGHKSNGECTPQAGESVVHTNEEFDKLIASKGIKTLYYVGYAANTDMMWGVGGMQRFYSMNRYLGETIPDYYWVDEATIGLENAETLADSWGKKAALAYRQPLLRASYPLPCFGRSHTIRARLHHPRGAGGLITVASGESTVHTGGAVTVSFKEGGVKGI